MKILSIMLVFALILISSCSGNSTPDLNNEIARIAAGIEEDEAKAAAEAEAEEARIAAEIEEEFEKKMLAELAGNSLDLTALDSDINFYLPRYIEQSFFENKIVAGIEDQRAADRLTAYYTLTNFTNVSSSDETDFTGFSKEGMLLSYAFSRRGPVYALDPNMSERETNQLLDIYREHTDLAVSDIFQMYMDSGIHITESVDPYTHVRFGQTRDILLLDIEWHTGETWPEYIEEYKESVAEYKNSERYMELSDEDKENIENNIAENMQRWEEEELPKIQGNVLYVSKTINGKPHHGAIWIDFAYQSGPISQYLDEDGYYILTLYPYYFWVGYEEENGEWHWENFGSANSSRTYERILQGEVIPYCDDLLERGLITQERYDYLTIPDLLAYYAEMFF